MLKDCVRESVVIEEGVRHWVKESVPGLMTLVPLLIKTAKNVTVHTICVAFERSSLGLLLGANGVARASIAAALVVLVAISTVASCVCTSSLSASAGTIGRSDGGVADGVAHLQSNRARFLGVRQVETPLSVVKNTRRLSVLVTVALLA